MTCLVAVVATTPGATEWVEKIPRGFIRVGMLLHMLRL